MEIVVFGAGSLGSLVGGLLAAKHDVTLIGRAPHVDAVAETGLRLRGLVERTVHPRAVTDLDVEGADLAIVAVKTYDTAAAAEALEAYPPRAALSLQNGMGNEETLARRLASPVLAGATAYGARLIEPGVVECTGVGSVTVGPLPDLEAGPAVPVDVAESVARAFRSASVETAVRADMRPVLWEKLAVNAGINPTTALARVRNGAVLTERLWPIAARAAAEVADTAQSAGVDLSREAAREALREVAEATAANRSSMLQDVETARRTEVDAIAGYVVERADGEVPVNRTFAALLRAQEAARGLR